MTFAAVIAVIRTIWAASSGIKTYTAAAGLVALSFCQIRNGTYEPAIQSLLTGFVAIGLRDAIATK